MGMEVKRVLVAMVKLHLLSLYLVFAFHEMIFGIFPPAFPHMKSSVFKKCAQIKG